MVHHLFSYNKQYRNGTLESYFLEDAELNSTFMMTVTGIENIKKYIDASCKGNKHIDL